MPWKPSDAHSKTHKATTEKKQSQWSAVANSALSRGASEASAIKQANTVVARGGVSGAKKRKRPMLGEK